MQRGVQENWEEKKMSIGIGDIVKLDQKNRLHLPRNVMRVLGIDDNSSVIVTVDFDDNDCIKIYRASEYLSSDAIREIEGDKGDRA